MDVDAYLAESAARVDRFLDAHVPPASERPERLHAAMRHLLFPGGKRFRPALAFAAAQAAGGDSNAAVPIAAAIELVHTYSLVHDDLPCMDDDALRRGQPTVHVAFDEATAVLAGDGLLAEAFRILLEAGDLAPEVRVAAARELAAAASSRELVGGQSEDLAAGDALAEADVAWIHERKTAALFRAAVVGGARVASSSPATLERLGRFARDAGMAFQIADDLLDEAQGGAREACSLVTVLGSDEAGKRAEALLASALAELESLGEPAEPLRELARFAVGRTL
ncbi:MAG: polyprenyl synthetase family protein [Deltaproteobacteria bacterium]|nr:polyprenyl synthetase family protein [Deltaproteobacteria bacterium]MBW2446631.1 polyprenyl synthetase family protein [Deltaproteobacteria bacterium]